MLGRLPHVFLRHFPGGGEMRCDEIPLNEVCGDLAQLHGMWMDITGGGPYDLEERGYSPIIPFLSHRATIIHVTAPNDPLDWIIQAYSSDFDVLANHSFVGRRLREVPDAAYMALIASTFTAHP
jgi:hypothetical protein